MLFYEEKWEKEFLSQIGGRLRRGAKPVRLAAGALLLYVRVVAGCAPCRVTQLTLGAVPRDPLTAKLRLDTNDALASSVQRRRYALKVPAAYFNLAPAEAELKINLISVV